MSEARTSGLLIRLLPPGGRRISVRRKDTSRLKIYLVRHGVAEERGGSIADEDRALTTEGKRRTRKAMRGFARLRDGPSLILSSPLVRAWQTAEIVAKSLGADRPRLET